jgi:cytochrome c556
MRFLVGLLMGAVIGGLLAMTLANALQRRNAWPRALMNVMQHELGGARSAVKGGTCVSSALQRASAHLTLLAEDLEPALLEPGSKDRVLSQYAAEFRKVVSAWNPAMACALQAEALTVIANACEACHRDYR